MLNKRITIARRVLGDMGAYGKNSGGQKYELLCTVWASETWSKGVKNLYEGALDAYDTVMFRMRYRSDVDRWCIIQYQGRWYEIQSLNGDYQENQLQITAIERANQQVMIVEPDYVDLGLPSGTLWAKFNVGATKDTEYGNYYMYGKGAKQYDAADSIYEGMESPLDAQYDTATQVMGAPWHMPTRAQFQELIDNTIYSWETNFNGSGVNGGKFTSKTDTTKYLFFPEAGEWVDGNLYAVNGCYWSSSPLDANFASSLTVYDHWGRIYGNSRKSGQSIRGVRNK